MDSHENEISTGFRRLAKQAANRVFEAHNVTIDDELENVLADYVGDAFEVYFEGCIEECTTNGVRIGGDIVADLIVGPGGAQVLEAALKNGPLATGQPHKKVCRQIRRNFSELQKTKK